MRNPDGNHSDRISAEYAKNFTRSLPTTHTHTTQPLILRNVTVRSQDSYLPRAMRRDLGFVEENTIKLLIAFNIFIHLYVLSNIKLICDKNRFS